MPFSRPIDFEPKKKANENVATPSSENYTEDDFEDDFEPYETSHENAEEEVTEKAKTDATAQGS